MNFDRVILSSVEKSSFKKQVWQLLPPLIEERMKSGVCDFNASAIYCFCGYNDSSLKLASIERLSMSAARAYWSKVSFENRMIWEKRWRHYAEPLENGILVFGNFGGWSRYFHL